MFSAASAEFFADIMLCPFEAVKVRIQTSTEKKQPRTFVKAFNLMLRKEGVKGFYKGLGPLWMR